MRLLQRRHLSVGVALLMGTLPLPRLVERPVFVEIATAAKRSEAQHRLGSVAADQRAPVMPSRSLTKWRQAPSMTPEPIGSPAARY